MLNQYKPEGYLTDTSENSEYLYSPDSLKKAMQEGKILESTVLLCDSNLSLHLNLNNVEGIIEKEDAVYCLNGEKIKDIAIITRVGKPVCFKIKEIYEHCGKYIAKLSRKDAQIECYSNYLQKLSPGDIIPATVTHTEPFGAFVDIGCGISSLLSVDCISVSRISHPLDRLFVGEQIYTVVKSIDRSNGRIFVSTKELLGTWEENASMFEAGQTVFGIVRSIESYGVFIELTPNLAGLAEIRENTDDASIAVVGKRVAVYIKSIIPDRMKIKLVLIDSYKGDPPKQSIKYFITPKDCTHIDSWTYSPQSTKKIIETKFI